MLYTTNSHSIGQLNFTNKLTEKQTRFVITKSGGTGGEGIRGGQQKGINF